MENLICYTAFIQFVGAFNFAFVIDFFEVKLKAHFLNNEATSLVGFKTIESKISSDIETMNQYEPLISGNQTNEKELNQVKKDLNDLLHEKNVKDEKIKSLLNHQHSPLMTGLFFLIAGLYTVIVLIMIGKINHAYAVNQNIGIWGCCLNMISVSTIIAYILILLMEVNYQLKDKARVKKRRLFTIGVIYMLASVVISFTFIKNGIDFASFLSETVSIYLVLCIPVMAFAITVALFLCMNVPLFFRIMWATFRLSAKWKKIAKAKEKALDPYAHLSSSDVTFS